MNEDPVSPDAEGSPACAGIDPARGFWMSKRDWLPRVRGDRPSRLTPVANVMRAPPRARG